MKRRRQLHRTDFAPTRFVWREDIVRLFGKIPDKKLAKLMRVSKDAVRDERVADALGVSKSAVSVRRRVLGIPSYCPHPTIGSSPPGRSRCSARARTAWWRRGSDCRF